MIHSAYLYPAVAPVGYYDVSIDVHRHSCGGVELAIAFTIGAKFQQEFSFCVENLQCGFQREATAEREHFFKKIKINGKKNVLFYVSVVSEIHMYYVTSSSLQGCSEKLPVNI